MASFCDTAIVLCPESVDGEQVLLGLSLGERVLLALSYSGVKSVAFVGEGKRPVCQRADIEIVDVSSLDTAKLHLVVPIDAVFDRGLLAQESLPDHVAMAYWQEEQLREGLQDPKQALEKLGQQTEVDKGVANGGKGFAIRVIDKASSKRAEKSLLLSLRKPMDGVVSTYLNRHVSLFCTRYLIKTGLPPNFFTVIFMFIGLAGAYFATQAQFAWALVLAGLLFQGQSILDGCDGEMARLTFQFSKRGQWLDSIGDDLTNYSVCFGLAVGQARVLDNPTLYWLGAAVLLMQVLTSAVLYRRMLIIGTGDLLAIPDMVRSSDNEGFFSAITESVGVLFKRDSFIFLLSLMVIFQQPLYAFYVYGIGTIPMTLGVLLNEYRITQSAKQQIA